MKTATLRAVIRIGLLVRGLRPTRPARSRTLKTPKPTADQKELLEWLPGGYDSERFDLAAVNRLLSAER